MTSKVFLFLTIACFSCRYENPHSNENIEMIQVLGEEFSDTIFNIELINIIPLESSKASVFGEYYKMKIMDSCIFVFDQFTTQTILKFDLHGHFIRKLEKGGAPFELVDAYAASFDGLRRKVYVYDYGDKKIKVYDFDLNYLTSLEIEDPFIGFTHFVKLSSGKWLSNTYYKYFDGPDSSAHYLLLDSTLKIIEQKYLPITELIDYPAIFQNPLCYDYEKLEILFFNEFENCIYSLDMDYNLIKAYNIDFGVFNITNKDRKSKKVHELAELCHSGLRKGHLDYLNSNKHFLGFEYTFNGNYTEFCIYSKENMKSISSEQLRNRNLPLDRLVHIESDYFVCAVEPGKVLDYIESTSVNKNLLNSESIKLVNNPVLVYYSINTL